MFVLTVVIRTVGLFAKALKDLRSAKELELFFDKMIELSETKILTYFFIDI